MVITGGGSNLSGSNWWAGVTEEDAVLTLPLDGTEGGLFSGNFVPPPPRPIFLDETATPDGLTTCDLCSWAWQNGNAFNLDATMGSYVFFFKEIHLTQYFNLFIRVLVTKAVFSFSFL